MDRITRKDVPVSAEWKGALRPDYKLLELSVQPEQVELKGAEKQVRPMTQVRVVVPVEFDDPPAQWSEDVPIKLAEGLEANPGQVRVTLRFGPELKSAWVRVPVRVDTPPDLAVAYAPKFLRLNMEGPVGQMREAEAGREIKGLTAVARVAPGARPGTVALSYEVEAPAGFRVLERPSTTMDVRIRRK